MLQGHSVQELKEVIQYNLEIQVILTKMLMVT